jgi:VCBS repeat-containing protein
MRGGKFVLVNGQYGQLKIYENGQYTYTVNANNHVGNHTDVFNYVLKDFDGDSSPTTLTINIVDKVPSVVSATPSKSSKIRCWYLASTRRPATSRSK